MKKDRYFIVLKTLNFCLCYLCFLSSVFAQSDAITNERLPVKAKQLEVHWQVDCALTFSKAQAFIDTANNKNGEITATHRDLKKCMLIYNTPDTAHFKPKPDYKLLLEKLGNVSD